MTNARRWWRQLRRATVLTYERGVLSIAKGAAYSGLLALFPVLTTGAAILVQAQAQPVLGVLRRFLAGILPPGTEAVVLERFASAGRRPGLLLVLAALLAIYAASGVMMSLMEGFNAVYHVERSRPFLKQRAVAALLVVVTAAPSVGASVLILFGTRTEQAVIRWLSGRGEATPLESWILLAGQAARYAIALGTVVLVTGLLYRLGPNRRQQWREVWPGAWLATVLWLAATSGFAWWVRNIAGYNVLYGSVGAVMALLVWIYLLAVIACFGSAFNAARERKRAA